MGVISHTGILLVTVMLAVLALTNANHHNFHPSQQNSVSTTNHSLHDTKKTLKSPRTHHTASKREEMGELKRFSMEEMMKTLSGTGGGSYAISVALAAYSHLLAGNHERAQDALKKGIDALTYLLSTDDYQNVDIPGMDVVAKAMVESPEFAEYRQVMDEFSDKLAEVGKPGNPLEQPAGVKWWEVKVIKSAIDTNARLAGKASPFAKAFTKAFAKVAQWIGMSLKSGTAAQVGGNLAKGSVPVVNAIFLGYNSYKLGVAIRNGDTKGIVKASFGIAAGVVGLGAFAVGLMATGAVAAWAGPVGIAIGGILTLTGLIIAWAMQPSDYDIFKEKLQMFENLRDGSIGEVDSLYDYLSGAGVPFTDLYLANQAAAVWAKSIKTGPLHYLPMYPIGLGQGQKHLWMSWQRKFAGGENPFSEALDGGKYMPNGDAMNEYKGKKEHLRGDVGFDFYGRSKGDKYKGATIIVNTGMISNYTLRPISIDTGTSIPGDVTTNDNIKIANYFNMIGSQHKDWDNSIGYPSIDINTGDGHDSLNIDGIVLEQEGLTAYLGSGDNTLSFLGMSPKALKEDLTKGEMSIIGMQYFANDGTTKFFYSTTQDPTVKVRPMGHVKGVRIFHGSPGNDQIIIGGEGGRGKKAAKKSEHGGHKNGNKQHQKRTQRIQEESIQAKRDELASKQIELPDFLAVDFDGMNTYVIDLNLMQGDQLRKFKIIDMSEHACIIDIPGMKDKAYQKDIIYKRFSLDIYRNGNHIAEVKLKTKQYPVLYLDHDNAESYTRDHGRLATAEHRTTSAFNKNGIAMVLYPKRVEGSLFSVDFERGGVISSPGAKAGETSDEVQTQGTDQDDILRIGLCPNTPPAAGAAPFKFDMMGGRDYLLINEEFLDSCEVGGEEFDLKLKKSDSGWVLETGNDLPDLELNGVEEVINSFGHTILKLDEESDDVDLKEKYFEVTADKLGFRKSG